MNVTVRRDDVSMAVTVALFAVVDDQGRWSRCWFLPDRLDEWNGFFAGTPSGARRDGSSSGAAPA